MLAIVTTFILIVILVWLKSLIRTYYRKKSLRIIKHFTTEERETLVILIDSGTMRLRNIPKAVEDKLIRYRLITVKGKKAKLRSWFRDSLKGI